MSRYKVKDRIDEKIQDLLFEVVGTSHNKHDFHLVLYDLLSPVERLMIGKRIAIMYLLELNIDYEVIRSTLCVSTSTIAKCVMMLSSSRKIKDIFGKLVRNKILTDGILTLISHIYHPGVYGFNWSSAKSFQNEIQRRKREGI